MSTHTNFLVFGTGGIGSFIIDEFLKLKGSGAISTLKIASRSVRFPSAAPAAFPAHYD
jgi:hypothetical protein